MRNGLYLDHIKTETFIFTNGIHILFQIHIKKLEHEVEFCFRMHNIQQSKHSMFQIFFAHKSFACDSLDNIVVLVQLFQQTDFSDRGAWHTFIFCFKTNPLEGDNVARFEIFGFEHDAIGTCIFFILLSFSNPFGKTVNNRQGKPTYLLRPFQSFCTCCQDTWLLIVC